MSKIALSPNASGTGTLTIAAPNTNSDASITLPAITGGEFIVSNASGNVGINKPSPGCSLDVAGGIRARGGAPGALGVNNNGYAFSSPGDNDSGMFSSADGRLEFYSNNDEVLRVGPGAARSSITTANNTLYPEFQCRAWVNFNGTGTVAIRGSGNVSSITDLGTGTYRANFSTSMPDTNYAFVAGCQEQNWGGKINTYTGLQTGYVDFYTFEGNAAARYDPPEVYVAIFR